MQLEDFVSETIRQIIAGTAAAMKHAEELGAAVNPANTKYGSPGETQIRDRSSMAPIQQIEFDVAVTTTSGTETKGGIGIVAGPFAVGSTGKSDAATQSLSRVRFSVPIQLPKTGEDTPARRSKTTGQW